MGNASQINRSRNSVRVERRSDLNESDLGEVYCIYLLFVHYNNLHNGKILRIITCESKSKFYDFGVFSIAVAMSVIEKLAEFEYADGKIRTAI